MEKSLIFLLLLQIVLFTNGDVETRIDDLEAQVKELKEEIGGLDDLEKVVKRNIADQKLDKTIASILLNEQEKASMHWKEVNQFLEPSLQPTYLKHLIESTYLGNSDNFYYILDFLTNNTLYMGYPLLYKDLEMHGELRTGQEIFALAHIVKSTCGTNNVLYTSLPNIVRTLLAGPVILKNIHNGGYILAGDGPNDCFSNRDCYEYPKNQIFIVRLQQAEIDKLQTNPKAHWQFMGPPTTNVTELASGFFIKNQKLFFVFHQRPPATYLRSNLTFDSYHARDMHAQFEPALLPHAELDDHHNHIRIGVRERMFKKISYFFAGEFAKRNDRLDFSRLPIFQDKVEGFVWEVTPVSNDTSSNAIEGGEQTEKCSFTM